MKSQETIVKNIRREYENKETDKFERLKALDKKAKRPAKIFAYVYGSISSLILGTGMCLAMNIIGTELSFAMPLGIGVGVTGIALMLATYPIYKAIMKSRKKKYAERIFGLSDSLTNRENQN